MIYLIIILYLLFLISKHDRDVSRYNYRCSFTFYILRFLGLWKPKVCAWLISNTSNEDNWWTHNVFSFRANGWKFWESVSVASFCAMTVLIIYTLYQLPIWAVSLLYVTLYCVIGLVHSLLDKSLFNK